MRSRMSRRVRRVALGVFLALLLIPILPGVVVRAATYTVTTAADAGPGSLREAITSGADTITFAIGGGAQTIVVQSMLPAVVTPTTIDATTQPGFAGGPLIEIRGNMGIVGGIGLKLFADNSTVKGVTIDGFAGSGIFISGKSNTVQNSVVTGNTVGVYIAGGNSNIIGGTAASARNIISGNGNVGMLIGSNAQFNQVQGNFIGTDASGAAAAPNPVGIFITGASGNVVGPGNVISGNTNNGVSIDTNSGNATFNVVKGNKIGTDVSGTAQVPLPPGSPQPYQNVGIAISAAGVAGSSASNNTVGGPAPGDGNVISGNFNGNVTVVGIRGTATQNTVQNNFIGVDVTGSAPVGHCDAGVYIRGASGNTILGNVISGNSRQGINSTGLAIDGSDGVPAEANVVQGNFIGTNAAGTAAITNGAGIYIAAANRNTIGGTTAAARNIIAGNSLSNGIAIDGRSTLAPNPVLGATGNTIQGNYIGTNAAGTAAVTNGTGVTITNADGNTVGGTAVGAGNVISGNTTQGVSINILVAGATAQGNVFQGNLIGTNAAGNGSVPNGYGVSIAGASNNMIGGAGAGARNVISGNSNTGIYLNGNFTPQVGVPPPGVMGTLVQGNLIGTDITGANALGNGNVGIQLDSASSNTIDSNVIAFNAQQGVLVNGATNGAVNDAITGNPIYANVAESIRLVSGGNNGQPAPGLTGASYTGGKVRVTGAVFVGTGNIAVRIDFFSNPTATSQGKVYLGSTFPTSDAGGVVTIDSTINANLSMPFITVTASPAGTNTSPFSPAFAIAFPAPAIRSVSPNQGTGGGGTPVIVTGVNFIPGGTVKFGTTPATSVTVAADGSSLVAVAPQHAGGVVNVIVTNPDGQSASLQNAFTYLGLVPIPQPPGPNNPTAPSPVPPHQPNGPNDPGKPNPLPVPR